MDVNNTTILSAEKYYTKRAFKEMCYIKARRNTLNDIEDLLSLNPIYHNLIRMASDNQ